MTTRVLHVGSTFGRGGIAIGLWHWLSQLNAKYQVEIAGLYELGKYGERLAALGMPGTSLGLATKYDPRGLSRLVRHIERGQYDIVHAHGWPAILYVALASLFQTAPRYVLTEHNVTNRRRRWKLKSLERFEYSRYRRIVANSQVVADALVRWLPETAPRVSVIHTGLAWEQSEHAPQGATMPAKEWRREAGQCLILSAGGLEYRKGVDVLIAALARLDTTPAPHTLIAGVGPVKESLERQAQAAGIASRVEFIGYRSDMPALIRQADVFVSSSRWEGCPMVILEAMAAGAPIAATAVGGVPEMVENGKSGLVVPAENPGALADALACLLTDRELAGRLGCAAQVRCRESFRAQDKAAEFASIYESLK